MRIGRGDDAGAGLASAAGIGRVTLVRLEGGEQSPRYETLMAIARALDACANTRRLEGVPASVRRPGRSIADKAQPCCGKSSTGTKKTLILAATGCVQRAVPPPISIAVLRQRISYNDYKAAPKDEIVLCAYNSQMGLRLDDQLRAFGGNTAMPSPDVLLLSEVDRGCTRNRQPKRRERVRPGAWFVLWCTVSSSSSCRDSLAPVGVIRRRCEHGNAIASRFPLGNVRLIRHKNRSELARYIAAHHACGRGAPWRASRASG